MLMRCAPHTFTSHPQDNLARKHWLTHLYLCTNVDAQTHFDISYTHLYINAHYDVLRHVKKNMVADICVVLDCRAYASRIANSSTVILYFDNGVHLQFAFSIADAGNSRERAVANHVIARTCLKTKVTLFEKLPNK